MKNIVCFFLLLLRFQAIAQSAGVAEKSVDSLLTLGVDLFKQKKFEQSVTVLRSAQTLARQLLGRESALYASCAHYLGTNYISLGRTEEALPLLLEALEIRRKVLGPDHPDCGKTLNNLALLCKDMGKLADAENYAIEALRLKATAPGKKTLEYSNSQNTLAQILQSKGQYAKADSVVIDLLERRKGVLGGESNVPYANALNFRAGLLTLQQRFEEAEENYVRALSIMKATSGEHSFPYLSVSINLGQVYAKMGAYQKAETAQRACIQLAADLLGKGSPEYALAVYNLGFVLQQQGRFMEALPILEDALHLSKHTNGKERSGSVQIMGNLAAVYYYLGDFNKAAILLKNGVEAFEKSEFRNEDYYNALLNYGTVLYNLKDYEGAEKYLLKAENDYTQLPLQKSSSLHLNLGLFYLAWGKMDLAEQRLLKAVNALADKRTIFSAGDVSIFFRLVQLYQKKNDYAQALKYAQAGQAYLEKSMLESINYLSEAEIREVAAFFFSRNGSIFEAAEHWNKAELNEVCYDNLLFTKGFVLENALKLRRNFAEAGQTMQKQWLSWKALRRQIADEFSKPQINSDLIDALEAQAGILEKSLLGTAQIKKLPHWQEVQNALADGEAAVEFVRYVDDAQKAFYMALVLTKNAAAPQAIPLCEEKELAELFVQDDFPLAKCYGNGTNVHLYQLIFKPLIPYIGKCHAVSYAPAGLLHRVNFQAMTISEDQILADNLDLTLLGSTRQVIEKKPAFANRLHPSSALLLGGIRYGAIPSKPIYHISSDDQRDKLISPPWQYLAASLNEVKSIARLLKAANIPAKLFSDSSATEQLLRQSCAGKTAPGILHIASHAFYSPDTSIVYKVMPNNNSQLSRSFAILAQNPLLRVKIVMAGADDADNAERQVSDDGYLTAYEISLLDLNGNQLSVVSACDSGLGDVDPNEGVWGLSRAFRIAGARNVILSLWKSSDSGANDFMSAFYLNWLTQKMSIHHAFAAAQKSLRNFNPDPKYWAGFVLSE